MRFFLSLLFIFLLFLSFSRSVSADSSYILPYPSAMPGSKIYKVNLLWEKISKYWYFGSFGQLKYNLRFSDKYLVEAKTLFEYKQYFLAISALRKSDYYFQNLPLEMNKAKEENKNIVQTEKLLKEAGLKHVEVLNYLDTITPDHFAWNPEKSAATQLNLKKSIEESIRIRENL